MRDPETLKFAATHEWVAAEDGDIEGDLLTVGLSKFAADQLTDVTLVELPTLGAATKAGAALGVIETVKAVSDIYAPVDGVVVEVNDDLLRDPERMLGDPYGLGWLIKIRPSHPDQINQLLDHAAYQEKIS